MNSVFFKTLRKTALLAALWVLASGTTFGAILFEDDFSGLSLNESVWRLPTGDGTFFGRTQIKPSEYNSQNLRPVVANGSVTLQLDTYNASGPGSFWGHEIQTYEKFLPGTQGISIETRIRFLGSPPGGLVGGFFTWGYDGFVRDEIDVELLTNDLDAERIFTNVYNNADFNTGGIAANAGLAGFDMMDWNTYEILWLPDRIQWLLNGTQVREQIITVAGHSSEVRLNIWAPNEGFSNAYNVGLQPSYNAANNQQYELEIDYVRVSSVPLPPAFLLFSSALALLGWAGRRRSL